MFMEVGGSFRLTFDLLFNLAGDLPINFVEYLPSVFLFDNTNI